MVLLLYFNDSGSAILLSQLKENEKTEYNNFYKVRLHYSTQFMPNKLATGSVFSTGDCRPTNNARMSNAV